MSGLNLQSTRTGGEAASVVVPAYNEEAGIGAVLKALAGCPGVERITVVDDGSSDGTAAAVMELLPHDPRLRLLRHPENRGKGAALATGVDATPTDLVVFLDADLLGLEHRHIQALIEPVRKGDCLMSLGIFSRGRSATDLPQRVFPGLTGQRCLRWSRLGDVPGLSAARYGAEVVLNRHIRRMGFPVQPVAWSGVSHRTKYEKRGARSGFGGYLRMYLEVLRWLAAETHNPRAAEPARLRAEGL